MKTFSVGDHVRHHSYAHGWRFGVIIGRHSATVGINASGLDMATVRFAPRDRTWPIEDHAVPCFQLESCLGHYPEYLREREGGSAFFQRAQS